MAAVDLNIPIGEEAIRALRVGDSVRLYGTIVTARDAAHKYIMDNFVRSAAVPPAEEALHAELQKLWRGGAVYHCGPVVSRDAAGQWHFVAAGPTTSIREEPYEAEVIAHFGLRAVIGKGGMGPKTLDACRRYGAVYLHAIGGAATLIASSVQEPLRLQERRVRRAGGLLGHPRRRLPGRGNDGRAWREPARAHRRSLGAQTCGADFVGELVFVVLSNGARMRTRITIESVTGPFVQEVETISGQKLLACNQCGKCSSGCPVAEAFDLLPSAVIRLAQLGMEDVLEAQSIWICASCLTCAARCPKGVDLARVMEALRTIAMQRGIQPVDVAALSDELVADLPQMAIIGGFRKYNL